MVDVCVGANRCVWCVCVGGGGVVDVCVWEEVVWLMCVCGVWLCGVGWGRCVYVFSISISFQ